MLTFSLAISCLTTSNLPSFMDLTFQVAKHYCSLQHQILLPSPVTSTTGHCFRCCSISSFFLKHISPLFSSSILGTYPSEESIFQFISFCLFILFTGFSREEYWSGLPIPPPVDHYLSEPSTMTHPSWVALHSIAHSFTELEKAVIPVIRLISFQWFWFAFCLPSDR